MELLTLKQNESVEAYRMSFEQLVYHIRMYDKSISETVLISQFVLGLKDELRSVVELHLPDTMAKAATLAAIQEELLSCHKKATLKPSFSRSPATSTKLESSS